MKILYDYQIFNHSRGGIARYFSELIREALVTEEVDVSLGIKYSSNIYLDDINELSGKYQMPARSSGSIPLLDKINFRGKGRVLSLYNRISKQIDINAENKQESIRLLKQGDFDVFHPTYYDPYFLEYLGDKPFVLTIYDMTHEVYPEYFQAQDALEITKRKKLLASKAAKILAISEKTKQDIVDILDIDPSKIEVTYLASSISKSTADTSDFVFPEKYALFVGHRWIYKNFYLFARALSLELGDFPDVKLVCIGGGEFSPFELQYLDTLGLRDRVLRYDVDEPTLAKAYSNALFFTFPSLYEGFGIPLTEAFACDCPVLCSEASCFPELAKDAALYFDPKNIMSIRAAIREVLTNEETKTGLTNKGRERVKSFAWGQTAQQSISTYMSVVK